MAYSNTFLVTVFTKAEVHAGQVAAAIVGAGLVDPDIEIVHVLDLPDGDSQTEGTVGGEPVGRA